jgi:hypothetical protein
MNINNFLPGGQSSTNVDFGGNDWVEKFGKIASGGFSAGSLLSLFASKPQYIVKGENGDLEFQSMLEISVNEDSSLPSEPIEQSSFASYNRIVEPLDVKVRLGIQGYPSKLQSVIDRLSEMRKGTEKVTLITPSASYEDLMLQGFDYRKDNHSGHNVLLVDLTLKEVREVPTSLTTSSVTEPEPAAVSADSAADGSCASAEDVGETQTYTPSSAVASTAESSSGRKSSALHDLFGRL